MFEISLSLVTILVLYSECDDIRIQTLIWEKEFYNFPECFIATDIFNIEFVEVFFLTYVIDSC